MNANRLPELFIADIDGTLVPKNMTITPLTREALTKLHNDGVKIAIASGRPIDEVEISVGFFGLDFKPEFLIGMNGGEIKDNINGEYINQYLLLPNQLKLLCELMNKQDCNITMYKHGQLYSKFLDEMVERSSKRAGKAVKIVESLEEFYDEPNSKLMFRTSTPSKCDALEFYCNSLKLDGLSFFKTQSNLLEVCDKRVNKGAALHMICEEHQIDPDQVLAFGDASNDNEMLIAAGTGVCLKGGLEDTISISDEVTDDTCENEGVAKWILKNCYQSENGKKE